MVIGNFLLHGGRGGFLNEPDHITAAAPAQLREEGVVLAEVTVANISGALLEFLPQGRALAGFAHGDGGGGGRVLEQMKRDMEPECVIDEALAAAAVERPGHAGQRGKERTVARHPLLRAQRGRQRVLVRDLRGEIGEDAFEQRGIHEALRFRKAAEADLAGADGAFYFWKVAGLDETAHGPCHGIEEAHEEEAEVIAEGEEPAGVGKRIIHGDRLLSLGERLAEAAEVPERGEIALAEGRRFSGGG